MYDHEQEITIIEDHLQKSGISYKDKHILITGGAGFLGSWMCDVLIAQGAHVICLDNLSSGKFENVDHLTSHPNFRFINHDISQPIYFGKSVPNTVCYPAIDDHLDYVMHLASRASPFEFTRFAISIMKSTTLGTMNALGIAKEHQAKFFYASTSEYYGNPPPEAVPTPETYW